MTTISPTYTNTILFDYENLLGITIPGHVYIIYANTQGYIDSKKGIIEAIGEKYAIVGNTPRHPVTRLLQAIKPQVVSVARAAQMAEGVGENALLIIPLPSLDDLQLLDKLIQYDTDIKP